MKARPVPRSHACRWRAFLYTVFGDESYDESKARVFAVSGLFGSEDDWGELEISWRARTGDRIFHAVDCDSDGGEFANSTHAENKALYKDLTQLLCGSRIIGFGSAMDIAGHAEFFPDVPRDIPYYRCFRDVVVKCSDWAKSAIPRGPVKFTFDSRRESNYNAGVLYDYLVNLPERKTQEDFEEISFASRKLVGIQAADLYAREVMKHLDNKIGPVHRPMRRSMEELTKMKRFGFDLYMREYFQDFRRQFAEVAKRVGVDVPQYMGWLKENKIDDNVSSRHRYMIELYRAGRKREG